MYEFKKDKKWMLFDRLRERRPTTYFVLDLFFNIIIVIILVYTVRTYLISPFQVYGPSMCDTLNKINNICQDGFGEYLIVNKAVYYPFFGHRFFAPQRGDIIVFRPPHNPNDFYIKRIIGLPGEKINLQNGKVYVYNKEHQSGWEVPEEYLNINNKNQTYPIPSYLIKEYTVPEGMYFVLGDNRKKSTDSRTCFRGTADSECAEKNDWFLSLDKIEGKAWIVLWPFNKIRFLSNPAYGG